MEALRSIEDVQLVRLLRRDDRERLFVGSPTEAPAPEVTELVHLFALPRGGDTAAHIERYLEPVRSYQRLGSFGPEGPPTAAGLPKVLGMGRKDPASLFIVVEDAVGLPLPRLLVTDIDWWSHGGRPWLASLCRALSKLHGAGIACGRVLPRHLMVDPRGGAILAEPLTVTVLHRIHGGLSFRDAAFSRLHPDPGATPPEQLADDAPAPAGDMFQVGALLHRLVTGRPAYGEGSTLEIFNRVRAGRIAHPLPDDLGPLAALGAACLSPTPGDRPDAEAVAQLLDSDATEAMAPGDPEAFHYSSTFPPLMQLHDGEGANEAPPPAPFPAGQPEVDPEQAIAQFDALLLQAASRRRPERRRALPWLLGLVIVLSVALFFVQFPFGGGAPSPTSRVDPDRGGRTHAPSSRGGAAPHPGRASWHLDGLSEGLRSRIEDLGFPTQDVPLTSRRVGANCEVVTEGADGLRHQFIFPKCRTLSRVCTLDKDGDCAPRPDGTRVFRVLYDPDGRPQLLQAIGGEDQVLRNIQIP
jgi:hypothetical protein